MVYLDNSATTRAYDEVAEAVKEALVENYGNPSSLHGPGLDAEKALKAARKTLASVSPGGNVVFTSGGTESDNMAIVGAYQAGKRRSNRIITSTIEHPAVLETVKKLEKAGAEVSYIAVDENSVLDLDMLREEASKGAAVVSIMAVNNETGAKMPLCHVRDIIDAAAGSGKTSGAANTAASGKASGAANTAGSGKASGAANTAASGAALLHSDAVQALGKEDIATLPADLISVSAHKIHGPKGVGALIIKDGVRIPEFITGGGQEKGMRSGTENMPGIIGFARAVSLMGEDEGLHKRLVSINLALREGLESEIKDIRFNSPDDATPAILNVSFLGTRGEVILHTLEQSGIYVSTGSACSSGRNAHKSGSHVLKAMGLSNDVIEGAIRFSFGAFNTPEEVPFVVEKVKEAVASFRRLGTFRR